MVEDGAKRRTLGMCKVEYTLQPGELARETSEKGTSRSSDLSAAFILFLSVIFGLGYVERSYKTPKELVAPGQ